MGKRSIISLIGLVFLLLTFPFFPSYAPSFGAEVPAEYEVETIKMWVTAYSSSVNETDSTPFITAIGTKVRDGIAATNMLPLGTLIRIPSLFGEKIFVIEDRMHSRKRWVVDVWMKTREKAVDFGSALTDVQVIKRPTRG